MISEHEFARLYWEQHISEHECSRRQKTLQTFALNSSVWRIPGVSLPSRWHKNITTDYACLWDTNDLTRGNWLARIAELRTVKKAAASNKANVNGTWDIAKGYEMWRGLEGNGAECCSYSWTCRVQGSCVQLRGELWRGTEQQTDSNIWSVFRDGAVLPVRTVCLSVCTHNSQIPNIQGNDADVVKQAVLM